MFHGAITRAAQTVARSLGCGHSERVYQKALAFELNRLAHLSVMDEYSVPIVHRGMNIGSERVDLVVHHHLGLHLVELKAVEASVRRGRHPPQTGDPLPPSHVQLLKYVRFALSQRGAASSRRPILTGHVINFRQRFLHGADDPITAPCPVEIDMYNVATRQWLFQAESVETAETVGASEVQTLARVIDIHDATTTTSVKPQDI